jgi:hypothetical protein
MSNHGPDPDLRLDVAPIAGAKQGPAWRGGRVWRSLLVVAVAVALAAVVVGSLPSEFAAIFGPSATPTATRGAFPTATFMPLAAVPTTCPPDQAVTTFSPAFGPGVSVAPGVWLVGFSPPAATLHLAGDALITNGWSHKLLLVAGSDVRQPITLSASVVTIGLDPVLFSADTSGVETPTISFDPATVSAQNGWRIWPLYIIIRAAGCYFFQVQSGSVQTGWYFAAGR